MEQFSNYTDEYFLDYISEELIRESESKTVTESKIRDPRFFVLLVNILRGIQEQESKYFYYTLRRINKYILDKVYVTRNLKGENVGLFLYLRDYLFPRHPNYDKKVENMINIGIRKNPARNHPEFIIIKSDDSNDDVDISANTCVFKRLKNVLHETMRITIEKEIHYGRSLPPGITKHHIPKLRNEFLRRYPSRIPDSFEEDNQDWGGSKFKEIDSDFEEAWVDFVFNYLISLDSMSG